MRTNYVLIDFENVQPASLTGLDAEHFRVIVFVGAGQNKIGFEFAAALQRLGSRAEYVKIAGNGGNALDFHIAFYIGRISSEDPKARFHIISKDRGFDPLILHLKERKIYAVRSSDVASIEVLKGEKQTAVADKVAVVVKNLQQRGASKPRTVKTLTSTINSLFQKQLTHQELAKILKRLQTEETITVDGTKITYSLPPLNGRAAEPNTHNQAEPSPRRRLSSS